MGTGPFPGPQAAHCFLEGRVDFGSAESGPAAHPVLPTWASRASWGSLLALSSELTSHLLTPPKPSPDGHLHTRGSLPAHLWPESTRSEDTDNFYQTHSFFCCLLLSGLPGQETLTNEADGIIPNIYQLCLLVLFSWQFPNSSASSIPSVFTGKMVERDRDCHLLN